MGTHGRGQATNSYARLAHSVDEVSADAERSRRARERPPCGARVEHVGRPSRRRPAEDAAARRRRAVLTSIPLAVEEKRARRVLQGQSATHGANSRRVLAHTHRAWSWA
eukprot:356539-Chlamydomonas_euryale.AAC.4